jgi:hypothetical protein
MDAIKLASIAYLKPPFAMATGMSNTIGSSEYVAREIPEWIAEGYFRKLPHPTLTPCS